MKATLQTIEIMLAYHEGMGGDIIVYSEDGTLDVDIFTENPIIYEGENNQPIKAPQVINYSGKTLLVKPFPIELKSFYKIVALNSYGDVIFKQE